MVAWGLEAFLTLAQLGGISSYALQDWPGLETSNVSASWTAPNDGLQHQVTVKATLTVTADETGGKVIVYSWRSFPDVTLFAEGLPAGTYTQQATLSLAPGDTAAVWQTTSLTAGAAVLNAGLSRG
ncbi:hypothetical protein [Actinospica sp.]|uniref:hypothetical protein n=1 Tax=Actinospica sp. TaxID=1872142 RepID=UPI002C6C6C93|nr:hypothetical protein [Actinospica sp.]HWG26097.1 hypothetical protein [Actinospica sp.]